MIKNGVRAAGYDVQHHPGRWRARLLAHHDIDLVVDVGASRGQTGKELRRFGYRGRIVSFEPLSDPFRHLEARAAADREWEVRNQALGERSGSAMMNVSSRSDASSFLPVAHRVTELDPSTACVGMEEVAVVRFDEIAEEVLRGARRAFLKVDVQGFEHAVLAGATDSLERLHGLQLEMSLAELYEGSVGFVESLLHVRSLGFELESLEPGFQDGSTGALLQTDGLFFRRSAN